jgi:hypothetical protein
MVSTKNYGEVDNLFTDLTAEETANVNRGLVFSALILAGIAAGLVYLRGGSVGKYWGDSPQELPSAQHYRHLDSVECRATAFGAARHSSRRGESPARDQGMLTPSQNPGIRFPLQGWSLRI